MRGDCCKSSDLEGNYPFQDHERHLRLEPTDHQPVPHPRILLFLQKLHRTILQSEEDRNLKDVSTRLSGPLTETLPKKE